MHPTLRGLTSKVPGVSTSPSNLSQADTPYTHNNDMPATTADSSRLQDLGYKQELAREWSLLHNFGVSFSIISMITGITTLMQYGLTTGGPAVVSIGWMVVCFFTMFVGLGMAEITSAIPTSGGELGCGFVCSFVCCVRGSRALLIVNGRRDRSHCCEALFD